MLLLVACILLPSPVCFADEAAQTDVEARVPAEPMSYLGAKWLEREDRIAEERPDEVIAEMKLKPGDTVADIGVGTGFFARRIAKQVAPEGVVYGVDIQPEMLELLGEFCKKEGIENVKPVLGDMDNPKLPEASLDWIILVDAYHEFGDPEAMLAHMRKALKPTGRVALLEYRLLGDTAAHIKKDHRMSVRQVLAEWNAGGFELIDLLEFLPAQHYFIFGKDPDRDE
jgi:SAM-dependent methyltransferase